MLEIKKEVTGDKFDGKINSWYNINIIQHSNIIIIIIYINFVFRDFTYYDRLIREKQYSVNEQEIQEYFPLQTVVDGTLDIYPHYFII